MINNVIVVTQPANDFDQGDVVIWTDGRAYNKKIKRDEMFLLSYYDYTKDDASEEERKKSHNVYFISLDKRFQVTDIIDEKRVKKMLQEGLLEKVRVEKIIVAY